MKKKYKHQKIVCLSFCIIFFVIIYGIIAFSWHFTYDKETHNCEHMSYELAFIFSKVGIPVKVMWGSSSNYLKGHCWLVLFDCIEFESTNLLVNPFNNNKNYYTKSVGVDESPWLK